MEKLNSLEILLEAKLDVRDHSFNHLRTWTKLKCRIEFVKTLPCFMKITLLPPNTSQTEALVLRINITGLLIQLASSRTKKFSYGLFWKTNRKRCCAFLAFESQFDFDQHLQWVKYWVNYLEYYRKDFILNQRINCDTNTTPLDARNNDSFASNINNTQNVKDIKEILGPLPKIPDTLNEDWVRRQSTVSGIYEEIGEFRNLHNTSRSSIVSGVYEDVHFENDADTSQNSIKPRKRIKTNEFLVKRSNTSTEADNKKKWSWTLHNVVTGFAKRFDAPRKSSKPTLDNYHIKAPKVSIRRHFKTTIQKSNRNSFSTPDLSNLPDSFINCHRGDSRDFLNISFESISNGYSLDEFKNLGISESNAAQTNSSIVNLLTTSHYSTASPDGTIENEPIYQVPKNIPVRLIDETGYCIMGPLRQDKNCEAIHSQPDNKCVENKNDSSSHYLRMDEVRVELRKKPRDEPIYANIEKKNTLLRNSIEEKLPSYLPNDDFYKKPKKHRHIRNNANEKRNVNLSSPKRLDNSPKRISKKQELNESYENAMLNEIKIDNSNREDTKILNQYGSLPHESLNSNPRLDGKNRFGSLPRLKKIDFSPLRAKLNNVFLRYNNSQV